MANRLFKGIKDLILVKKLLVKMIQYLSELSKNELIFLIIGFVGRGLFASRFIYQWLYSEKLEKVQYPLVFGI